MIRYFQLICVACLAVHIYTQLENSKNYRGPDYSKDIEDTVKRYSRESNLAISDIKQKLFERRDGNMKISQFFRIIDLVVRYGVKNL